MACAPEMEGSPVISEKMARLLRERWKEGLTAGPGCQAVRVRGTGR